LSSWKPHTSAITASIVELIVVTSSFARNAVIQALICSGDFPVALMHVNEIVFIETRMKRNILMIVL
jgi:hypothetical protein